MKKKTDPATPVDFHMRANTGLMQKLDDLRRRQTDLPSRAEMVRRLIEGAK